MERLEKLDIDEWKHKCNNSSYLRKNEKCIFHEVYTGETLKSVYALAENNRDVMIGHYIVKDSINPLLNNHCWWWDTL